MVGKNMVRIGTRLQIETYMENNGLAPEDSVWTLVHGGGNLWCLNCHDSEDRDKLVKLNGELLTFNESHLLCGECHGPKFPVATKRPLSVCCVSNATCRTPPPFLP